MPVSDKEYEALVQDRMKRYGGDRDKAIRSANIAAGYGSSTAKRKPSQTGREAQGKAAPAKKAKSKSPYKVPTPKPRPRAPVSPDLAVSPPMDRQQNRTMPMPAFEPGGGTPPNLGLPPFKPGLGSVGIVPPDLAFQPQGVPPNPAMSQASILQTPNPALQTPNPALQTPNMQLPAMTQPWIKPEAMGGGISSIFFDPNRPRRW